MEYVLSIEVGENGIRTSCDGEVVLAPSRIYVGVTVS